MFYIKHNGYSSRIKNNEITTDSINLTEKPSTGGGNKSVNFGPGADLLMNHSRKDQKKN